MGVEVLVFEIEDRRFGIHSCAVVEVVRAVKLSPPPQRAAMLEGLLNLRGNIVPILDLRSALGITSRPIKHTDHLIVSRMDGRVVTFRVDKAVDLIRFDDVGLQPAEDVSLGMNLVELVGKTEDGIVHVLDVGWLLTLDQATTAELETAAPSESTS